MLFVVLVVVVLLSLAAYAFSELMITHYEASHLACRQAQADALVQSGVETVRWYLMMDETSRFEMGGHFNNPLIFQGVAVVPNSSRRDQGDFTVIAPNLDGLGALYGIRYGLEDESTRLNLNALLVADQVQPGSGRSLLMGLPGMTEDVADAILDWMDSDDVPREYGAEVEYYAQQQPPYAPKNGPLDTVEDLLLVRGITPDLLFGRDTNRNGMVDTGEQQMLASMTMSTTASSVDLQSGILDRGWAGYLTLYSQEKNVTVDGLPRIFLNGDDLEQLYNQLTEVLDEESAQFIIAYRQYGPAQQGDQGQQGEQGEQGEPQEELRGGGARESGSGGFELDFDQPAQFQIGQVLDLIGAQVRIQREGQPEQQATTLASPFSDNTVDMASYLPQLMDSVTAYQGEVIPGRININQAPGTVLLGIPGMTETIVDSIIQQRSLEPESEGLTRTHETWLLTEGLVTLDEMKRLMPFITAGGDVFRAQIVGYFEGGGAAARAEVVFDATGPLPRVVFWREISHLGRGYPLELLGVQAIHE